MRYSTYERTGNLNVGFRFYHDIILDFGDFKEQPTSSYQVGANPPSFDKQFIRDWLEAQHWNKQAPAPRLPSDVILKTTQKYQEALRLLTADERSTV